jgi:hypothetical protein
MWASLGSRCGAAATLLAREAYPSVAIRPPLGPLSVP